MVQSVRDGTVWVQAIGPHNCPRCAEGRGCGGGLLSRLVRRRPVDVPVSPGITGLLPGDTVIVGLAEGELLSASVRAFLVPLAAMFALGAFAHLALQAHELLVVLFGVGGLAGGFLWLRAAARRDELSSRYRPVILRKDTTAATVCARLH